MKNASKTPLAIRLERLRMATAQTWDALAGDLGVKRAMVFHVLAGRRGFSSKTTQRLTECEVAAGLRSEASAQIERSLRGTELVEALLSADRSAQSEVTTADIDAGFKTIQIEYRRGTIPPGFPTHVRVVAPSNAAVWKVVGAKGTSDDPSRFLIACLPDLQRKPESLERLTPSCYARILDTALDLTFGLSWRSKLLADSPFGKSASQ